MTEVAGADEGSTPALTAAELDFLHGIIDLARNGETSALAAAIDSGVPVNLTNGAGDSLLILAAYHCHVGTVEMLLGRGADTERVNDRGQTALGAATFRQQREIVQLLLDAGADPNAGGRSALRGRRILRARGNDRDADGSSAEQSLARILRSAKAGPYSVRGSYHSGQSPAPLNFRRLGSLDSHHLPLLIPPVALIAAGSPPEASAADSACACRRRRCARIGRAAATARCISACAPCRTPASHPVFARAIPLR